VVDRTAEVVAAVAAGLMLPPGEFYVREPIVVSGGAALRGSPGTILRPWPDFTGAMVVLRSRATDDVDLRTHMPRGAKLSGVQIVGSGASDRVYGLLFDGARLRVSDVEIVECYTGISISGVVDAVIRDALLSRNFCNVYIPPRFAEGRPEIDRACTATRFVGCNIRQARGDGMVIQGGVGLTFRDCVIESNLGYGVTLAETADATLFDNCWFENNAHGSFNDPHERRRCVHGQTFERVGL
jgi:hypothetical protein